MYVNSLSENWWSFLHVIFVFIVTDQKHSFFSIFGLFLLTDISEGNFAWYWHLQCEGDTQEHVGAQARVQTLSKRGKVWWVVFFSLPNPVQATF